MNTFTGNTIVDAIWARVAKARPPHRAWEHPELRRPLARTMGSQATARAFDSLVQVTYVVLDALCQLARKMRVIVVQVGPLCANSRQPGIRGGVTGSF
jgi:hypothetical protein